MLERPNHPQRQPLDVNGLLRQYGLRPRKSLGQNFLVDETALRQVAAAAEIDSDDVVLEIGAGLGSLTRHLAALARRVVCVELDGDLISILQGVLAEFPNVEIIQGDVMALNLIQLLGLGETSFAGEYIVAANIPYYITSALIRRLLECKPPPVRIVLTVQREVADRICAEPGEMNLLGLSVQVYGKAAIVGKIPAGAFLPAPKVDSAIIRVETYERPLIPIDMLDGFFRLAKAGFSQKRKTLRNALAGGMRWEPTQAEMVLKKSGIDPMRRAETLTILEWAALSETAAQLGPEQQNQT